MPTDSEDMDSGVAALNVVDRLPSRILPTLEANVELADGKRAVKVLASQETPHRQYRDAAAAVAKSSVADGGGKARRATVLDTKAGDVSQYQLTASPNENNGSWGGSQVGFNSSIEFYMANEPEDFIDMTQQAQHTTLRARAQHGFSATA
ncbi:hypothetical protein K437DRAFT_269784 [Tilletiaria anomala UBC 951]|uniref:Uncharacterized protein n=1 Tax=Tilletiaria anomala (strain ATCC 24038 / CBS 436.72 / UBC 951) TaxID=1037660 RepID=A0A066VHD0_TILAU|nr:uncharacterized protein K437DRAFT_269784 [Tilletiaria anomala UBC 951]KDN41147.1 hypothetical protein K437DRAFT_269784 [Tilletiaria anomala UBC 951]